MPTCSQAVPWRAEPPAGPTLRRMGSIVWITFHPLRADRGDTLYPTLRSPRSHRPALPGPGTVGDWGSRPQHSLGDSSSGWGREWLHHVGVGPGCTYRPGHHAHNHMLTWKHKKQVVSTGLDPPPLVSGWASGGG